MRETRGKKIRFGSSTGTKLSHAVSNGAENEVTIKNSLAKYRIHSTHIRFSDKQLKVSCKPSIQRRGEVHVTGTRAKRN